MLVHLVAHAYKEIALPDRPFHSFRASRSGDLHERRATDFEAHKL